MIFNDIGDDILLDLCKKLMPFINYILKDKWSGLPDLTNKDGTKCEACCPTQAKSIATLIEALDEMAHKYNLLNKQPTTEKKKKKKAKKEEIEVQKEVEEENENEDEEPMKIKYDEENDNENKNEDNENRNEENDNNDNNDNNEKNKDKEEQNEEPIVIIEKLDNDETQDNGEEKKPKKVKKIIRKIKKIKKKGSESREESRDDLLSISKPEQENGPEPEVKEEIIYKIVEGEGNVKKKKKIIRKIRRVKKKSVNEEGEIKKLKRKK